jgi:acetyltransferase-like isoleucine patch superfamily enzyme
MLISNRTSAIFLFSIYSYLSNIFWIVLDVLPQFLREICFKIILKEYGKHCSIDYRCNFRYPWRVSIGDGVAINRGCELYSSMQSEDGMITIQDHAVLGPKVIIFAAGHDYSKLDLPDTSAPVVICSHCWIGGNTTILPGVTIGEGSVIGAGSVVTKNIAAYSIAVGNPAKVIGFRNISNNEED